MVFMYVQTVLASLRTLPYPTNLLLRGPGRIGRYVRRQITSKVSNGRDGPSINRHPRPAQPIALPLQLFEVSMTPERE